MAKQDNGGSAFPAQWTSFNGHLVSDKGMSLRDYFAAKALNGMLSHATRYKPRHIDVTMTWHEAIAKEAFEIADAMLEARKR